MIAEPPRGPLPPGAGRLLAALLAAGARRRPRHRRARRDRRRARAGQRRRQPGRAGRGGPGRVQRQLPRRARSPTCSTSWRSSPPTSPRSRERRTDRFLDRARNHDLPPFLADDPGVDSGLMIAQYTQAAIVSELKRLAVPASVDSIPSSAMQEDHVSMGWSAARKLRRSVDGLTRVVAIEVMTAARALDLRARPATPPARRPRRRPAPSYACCASTASGPRPRPVPLARDRDRRRAGRVGLRPVRRRRSDRRPRMSDEPTRCPSTPPTAPSCPRRAGRPRRRCGC